jgi:parvulin-like peptidyl-prolyl isomerase
MRTVIKAALLTVFFNVFLFVGFTYAHPPMPGRIYNPGKEYKAAGKSIPKLRKGKIAKVGSEYIKESDFTRWLGGRIERGLLFNVFILDVLIQQKARELGIKNKQKKKGERLWVGRAEREEVKEKIIQVMALSESDKLVGKLVKEAEITMSDNGSSAIAVVNGQEITEEDYGGWVFGNVDTTRFLENYISKLLFEKKAKELGIKVSEEDVERIKTERQEKMYRLPEDHRDKHALEENEIRADLYASRIICRSREITGKEIENRFFEKFGQNGRKYKIKHIFKRIKKKYLRKGDAGYDKVLKRMEKVARKKIERIHKRIQREGEENFRIIAQQESDDMQTRDSGGYIGELVKSYGGEFDEVVPALKEGEVSGILKSKSDFHIVKVDRKEGKKIYISHIQARKFYTAVEDVAAWEENKKELMKEMKKLLKRVKSGEDLKELAKENSDDYNDKYGYDISNTWERRYRAKFGGQLGDFKKGDIGIIESDYGLHIVKFEDITTTGYTDELKERLRDEIRSEVVPVQEMVVLAVKLMREAKVYYTQ